MRRTDRSLIGIVESVVPAIGGQLRQSPCYLHEFDTHELLT